MSNANAANMGGSSSKIPSRSKMTMDPECARRTQAIEDLQRTCGRFSIRCSHPGCKANVKTSMDDIMTTWSAGAQVIPPTTQLSTVACDKGHVFCAGCHKPPTIDPNLNIFTTLGVVNHCCNDGRLFAVYNLLARFDDANLRSAKAGTEKTAIKTPKSFKAKMKAHPAASKHKSYVAGVGYGTSASASAWGAPEFDSGDEEMMYANEYAMIYVSSTYLSNIHAKLALTQCYIRT